MTGRFNGDRVLVTGASSGIGHAVAKSFAARGATVIAVARRKEKLDALAAAADGAILPVVGDLTDKAFVARLVEEVAPVDILVNNAGMSQNGPFLEADLDVAETIFATNVVAMMRLSQPIMRSMAARGRGHVINITSVVARQTFANVAIYSATKHALRALTAGWQLEMSPHGVRISEVAPGLIGDTDFLRHTTSQAFLKGVDTRPYKPISAADVAEAVVAVADVSGNVQIPLVEIRPMGQP